MHFLRRIVHRFLASKSTLRAAWRGDISSGFSAAALFAVVAATSTSASAVTTAIQVGRTSVNYLHFLGGFAISGVEGEDGTPAPVPGKPWEGTAVTTPAPATLDIAGTNHHDIHYLFWDGYLDTTWQQTQTYGFDAAPGGGTSITGSGASTISQSGTVCGAGSCNPPSALHHSTNSQIIEFELSGPTDYTLTGATSGQQSVDLQLWNPVAARWFSVIGGITSTQDRSFDLAGDLASGRYRMTNRVALQVGSIPSPVVSAWNYALTLPSAAPIPEPGTTALWCIGFVGIVLKLRRARPPRAS